MSDIARTNALSERRKLEGRLSEYQSKIKRLQSRILEIDRFLAQLNKFAQISNSTDDMDLDDEQLSQSETDSKNQNDSDANRPDNPRKEEVAALVRQIIEERGQPINRAELFKAIRSRGLVLHGKDPEMVLSTMLWRTGKNFNLIRLKGVGYWISDKPHLETRYLPDDPNRTAEDSDDD